MCQQTMHNMGSRMKEKCLILLTFIISCSAHKFQTQLYNGTLSSSLPDVCTSQNVTFICTLLSPPMPSNSIGFAVKNENSNEEFLPVDEGSVNVINETSSEFTIYNVSSTSSVYVRCFYWEMFGDISAYLQVGRTSMASVYPTPVKVEQMNCIVENYIMSMKCSWNYGTNYEGRTFPDVTFQWRIAESSTSWNDCSELNVESGYCYWNSLHVFHTMEDIEIKLTLKEPCGIDISSDFRVNTRTTVKPSPVVGLKSFVLNSTCIQVSWRTDMQYPKEHKVIVASKSWGEHQVSKFNTTGDTKQERHDLTFCNLHPHTVYTFTVSTQPIGDHAGFYSDPRETVATTYSDIPSASPYMTEGGYSWNASDCKGSNTERRVCIFWKPIREEDKNGQMLLSEGTFTAVNHTTTRFKETWSEHLAYGCSASLMCNTSYILSLKARNSNGTSKDDSTLVISAATLGIPPPQVIVEADNTTNVSVSWTEANFSCGFIVAWCRNKNGKCENRTTVNWQHFKKRSCDRDEREAVIQINPENSPQDFLYGVSVLTEQGSSGVEWQDCVYLKNGDTKGCYGTLKNPTTEPQNVILSTDASNNAMTVKWDKLTCKSDEPYIAMFNVEYTYRVYSGGMYSGFEVNTYTGEKNVSANGEAMVVFKDLKKSETYRVTVRGITKDGRYGPKCHPRTIKLEATGQLSRALDTLFSYLLYGFGILFLVCLACGLCGGLCSMQRVNLLKKSLAKLYEIISGKVLFEDAVPDNPNPTCDDSVEETEIDRLCIEGQNSDSGSDPMTQTV